MTGTAIWWIRRDLRLADNQALTSALQAAERVLPVFILDPVLVNANNLGTHRLAFLLASLRALDRELQARATRLIFLRGDPLQVLAGLVQTTGAKMVFAESDVSPYARRRDARVAAALPLTLTPGLTCLPPGSVRKADGTPYTVFTPFSRAWRAGLRLEAPLPAPAAIPMGAEVDGEAIPLQPEYSLGDGFPAGEAEGRSRLECFIDGGVDHYSVRRDRMDLDGTSSLSPYLHFGMVSMRQAVWVAQQAVRRQAGSPAEGGAEAWLNELIWREFYLSILHHFPAVIRGAFKPALRRIPWRNDRREWEAWQAGQTGFPVVDAGMRQLAQTGWMHNRARMITASFLVKDLLIDWRRGERWFMQNLLDGDLAANNGGWQWTAGTGTDAAPYFRVFNPVLQGRKFDPRGDYVRRWVPALAQVPESFIHEPWRMSPAQQEQFGCILGKDYPAPLVDHRAARQRTLLAYQAGRGAAG